jgi:hypothetical protein
VQKSAEAYEALRSEALRPEDQKNYGSDRVVLRRQGMAAWVKRREDLDPTSLPEQKAAAVSLKTSQPEIVDEVVGLMAEIIIKSERFVRYA